MQLSRPQLINLLTAVHQKTRGLSAYIARWLLEMTDFVIMIL